MTATYNPATLFGDELDDRFRRWSGDNTDVVSRFILLARSYRDRGHKVSAKYLIERMRYDEQPPLRDFDNSLTSRLALYAEAADEGLRDYFRHRRLQVAPKGRR